MSQIGTLVIIKAGAEGSEAALVGQTEMSFSSTRDAVEVSDKLTGIHAAYEYGRMKNSISVSGICGTSAELTLKGFYEMLAYQEAGTKVSVIFGEYADNTAAAHPGNVKVVKAATCLVSKMDSSFPDSKENKFSCELTVSADAKAFDSPAIMKYSIPSQAADAVIDATAHTVAVTMPNGTDVSALVATFILTNGATAKISSTSQVSGVTANNFSSPKVYAVKTADTLTTVNWTVTVTVL